MSLYLFIFGLQGSPGVQYIIHAIIQELEEDPHRKFSYVEMVRKLFIIKSYSFHLEPSSTGLHKNLPPLLRLAVESTFSQANSHRYRVLESKIGIEGYDFVEFQRPNARRVRSKLFLCQ